MHIADCHAEGGVGGKGVRGARGRRVYDGEGGVATGETACYGCCPAEGFFEEGLEVGDSFYDCGIQELGAGDVVFFRGGTQVGLQTGVDGGIGEDVVG